MKDKEVFHHQMPRAATVTHMWDYQIFFDVHQLLHSSRSVEQRQTGIKLAFCRVKWSSGWVLRAAGLVLMVKSEDITMIFRSGDRIRAETHLSSLKSFLRTSRAFCRKFWMVLPFFIWKKKNTIPKKKTDGGNISSFQEGSTFLLYYRSYTLHVHYFTLTVFRCPDPSQ